MYNSNNNNNNNNIAINWVDAHIFNVIVVK
jgi:hypothetical protein